MRRARRTHPRASCPSSQLLHLVHLTGGTDNVFVTTFKGDCKHCHKLDAKTGAWSMPSGPEQ